MHVYIQINLNYDTTSNDDIKKLNINLLSKNGLIFLWVINKTFTFGFELLSYWGYEYLTCINWIKITKNKKLAVSNGYLLTHSKESCLVGIKKPFEFDSHHLKNFIVEERKGQSIKPYKLYDMIERMVPNGKYIELFGRQNNRREKWITIGNDLL